MPIDVIEGETATGLLLNTGLVLLCLALEANFKVDRLCWKSESVGEMRQIMTVKEFPPSEALRRRVSLESL